MFKMIILVDDRNVGKDSYIAVTNTVENQVCYVYGNKLGKIY